MTSSIVPESTEVHPNSHVGGFTAIQNGSVVARTFYQTKSGAINAWLGFTAQVYRPGETKVPTPISSVFFTWKGSGQSRTFVLDPKNQLMCFAVDQSPGSQAPTGYVKGTGGQTFTARDNSMIGTFAWAVNGIPHVRVGFQTPDNCVQQIDWDGNPDFRFVEAGKSPPTLAGTSLAFVNQAIISQEEQYFRGYYQYVNYTIMELINDKSRGYVGDMQNPLTFQTRITATSAAPKVGKKGNVAVFWRNQDGTVTRRAYDDDQGKWLASNPLPSSIQVNQNSGLLALSYVPPQPAQQVPKEILVYVDNQGKLIEHKF